MRTRALISRLAGAPALGAAAILAVFAGAGLLIAAAGPGMPNAPAMAPTAPTPVAAPRPAEPSGGLVARIAARDLTILDTPGLAQAPSLVHRAANAAAAGQIAAIAASQGALAAALARQAPDAVLETVPVGVAIANANDRQADLRVWCVVLAGNAALGITAGWATTSIALTHANDAWRVSAIAPLTTGPIPQPGAAGPARTADAAAIAGFTPVLP